MKDMINDGEYSGSLSDIGYSGMVRHTGDAALTAGGFPVKPSTECFSKPRFRQLTPLTYGANGEVSGHIAAWHQSHIGLAGSVKPPRSRSRYAFFQTGQLETAEGDMVDVGQITLTGGHAPLNASVADTIAHYDNTRSAVMDVAVFEDKYGIAVAGSLRPGVSDEQLRELRASAVSGDWRPINGNLELVAVCAVNVPGFPIPRARVASGAPVALVAAGTEPLIAMALHQEQPEPRPDVKEAAQTRRALRGVNRRVERLERKLVGAAVERRTALDEAIVAAAGLPVPAVASEETVPTADELRARVHGAPVITASALRNRVHGDPVEALRKRVHK